MSDRTLDLMFEKEVERLWEEQNAPDRVYDRLLESASHMNVAIEQMDKAMDSLAVAKDAIEGLNAEYRLGSLMDDYENLVCSIKALRLKFIDGKEG